MTCVDCGHRTDLVGRRLCGACYHRHRRAGTLEKFPLSPQVRPGVPQIDGVTYRQLDYWIRQGYLRVAAEGSGSCRTWPAAEVRVARIMARLVAAGVRPAAAERIARGGKEIAPGVRVLVKQ